MSEDLRILRLAVADDICLISRLSGIAVGVVFLPSDAVNEKRNDPWRVALNHTFLWKAIVAPLPLIAEKTQMPMNRVEQKKWRQVQRIELNLSLIGWLAVHRQATVLAVADNICLISRLSGITVAVVFCPPTPSTRNETTRDVLC